MFTTCKPTLPLLSTLLILFNNFPVVQCYSAGHSKDSCVGYKDR
jgi:hypothetical protein